MNSEYEQNVILSQSLCMNVEESHSSYTMIDDFPLLVGKSGMRALWLVAKVVALKNDNDDCWWTIKCRPDRMLQNLLSDHSICRIRVRGGLGVIVRNTKSDSVRAIAIWMCGLCAGMDRIEDVAKFRNHHDWRMRKEVIRALGRMKGWSHLRELEEHDAEPRNRLLAAQKSPEKFDTRFSRFARNLAARKIPNGDRKSIWIHKSVKFRMDFYPKSVELIRYYLKRIRKVLNE